MKTQFLIGRILSCLTAIFLLWDAAMKVVRHPMVVDATRQLGYPDSSIQGLGLVLLASTLLYLLPWTAPLGALLLTGYLGGAVATNLRVEAPLFSHLLFPIYVGAMVWAGLLLRRPDLRGAMASAARAPA